METSTDADLYADALSIFTEGIGFKKTQATEDKTENTSAEV